MSDGQVRLSDWTEERRLSIDMNTDALVAGQLDLATRVAADIFVRFCADRDDGVLRDLGVFREGAAKSVVYGRIFAEAVAKARL